MTTPIITLTTDWGNRGFFAGMVKGRLYSLLDNLQVVDISHAVEPYNVREASFIVRHACLGFPKGTVHIIDVASDPLLDEPFLVAIVHGHYFICCNNGLLPLAFGDAVESAIAIPIQENHLYNFAAHTLFAPTAAKLLGGTPLDQLGAPLERLRQHLQQGWMPQGNEYRVPIQYVDSYGNAYLGMTYREFLDLQQGRPFVMQVRNVRLYEVVLAYSQEPQRRMVSGGREFCLTVSATGLLELAVNKSSFIQLFGTNEHVLLEFR